MCALTPIPYLYFSLIRTFPVFPCPFLVLPHFTFSSVPTRPHVRGHVSAVWQAFSRWVYNSPQFSPLPTRSYSPIGVHIVATTAKLLTPLPRPSSLPPAVTFPLLTSVPPCPPAQIETYRRFFQPLSAAVVVLSKITPVIAA